MALATWPATVPASPLQGSYSEAVQGNIGSFQPDAGPPMTWRRAIGRTTKIAATFRMTAGELRDFLAFFDDELEDGAQPFSWLNPAYGVASRYLFDPSTQPRWEPVGSGQAYRVHVAMLALTQPAAITVPVIPVEEEEVEDVWLLADGVWNDDGIWVDSETWEDAP
jgi:hypothetical protein